MGLFADPAGFNQAGHLLERDHSRQVPEIVFAFARGTHLAHQSDLLVGQVLIANGVDRWVGPSAARIRTAQKRALNGPWCPAATSRRV